METERTKLQKKYGGIFRNSRLTRFDEDKYGYEGLASDIISILLKFDKGDIKFEECTAGFNDKGFSGSSIVGVGSKLVLCTNLYNILTYNGTDMTFYTDFRLARPDRRCCLLYEKASRLNIRDFKEYFTKIVLLDYITFNSERTLKDIPVVVTEKGTIWLSYIGKYSGGLLSNRQKYSVSAPIKKNLSISRPMLFGWDFAEQAYSVNDQVFNRYKFYFAERDIEFLLNSYSSNVYPDYLVQRALKSLEIGLKRSKGIAWEPYV